MARDICNKCQKVFVSTPNHSGTCDDCTEIACKCGSTLFKGSSYLSMTKGQKYTVEHTGWKNIYGQWTCPRCVKAKNTLTCYPLPHTHGACDPINDAQTNPSTCCKCKKALPKASYLGGYALWRGKLVCNDCAHETQKAQCSMSSVTPAGVSAEEQLQIAYDKQFLKDFEAAGGQVILDKLREQDFAKKMLGISMQGVTTGRLGSVSAERGPGISTKTFSPPPPYPKDKYKQTCQDMSGEDVGWDIREKL